MRNRDRPAPDRFWEKVDQSGECWLWTGGTSTNGYGRFSVNGRMVNAHRWAYEECVGPIPVARAQRANGRDETCRNGHERTPENVYTHPSGRRDCRECRRASDRHRYYSERASA